jgi:hypothetical protein
MVNVPSLENMLDKLDWIYTPEYRKSPHFPWFEDGIMVGWEKTWGNLTFA